MINTQFTVPEEVEAAEVMLASVAGLVYDELPHLLAAEVQTAVRDVWMVVDGDSTTLQITAEGVVTSQRLEPGTYLIVQLDSTTLDLLPTKGLIAFPVEG